MEKSRYLRKRFNDFGEIWHDNVSGTAKTHRSLKLTEMENSRWRLAATEKSKNRDILATV